MNWEPIVTEAEFMNPDNWGQSRAGNPICTVHMGAIEFTVVIFPRYGAWRFVISCGPEDKRFSKQSYTTQHAARYWAWFHMDTMAI